MKLKLLNSDNAILTYDVRQPYRDVVGMVVVPQLLEGLTSLLVNLPLSVYW